MTIEIKVPVLPESIADATVLTWHKQPGESVARDENLVDLETEKVVLEGPAPEDGVLKEILKPEGTTVTEKEILAMMVQGAAAKAAPAAKKEEAAPAASDSAAAELSPVVRRLIAEHDLDASQITGTGKDGRINKEDVMKLVKGGAAKPAATVKLPPMPLGDRPTQRVPMSRIRAKIAERLLEAQQNAAILTTFNEINMAHVMDVRKRYKDEFEKRYGVKLGFMSFFVKATVEALKRFPAVNAYIDGNDIIYNGFYDVGIAVSSERGLVVPILRDADKKSMADIEKGINDLAGRAQSGKLDLEEMKGGTFTISNGGVFGSLLSTPILNPPQSGILGMHKIDQRPIVENGEIVIRPMMYVAMSYDHCIIDGKDSVQFLLTIKNLLEEPARLLLDI